MEKIRDGESQKKEDAAARKGRKVMNHCVFPTFCGPGGSKSRLAEAAGAEPAGQMRDERLHVVVARSAFPSQKWITLGDRGVIKSGVRGVIKSGVGGVIKSDVRGDKIR